MRLELGYSSSKKSWKSKKEMWSFHWMMTQSSTSVSHKLNYLGKAHKEAKVMIVITPLDKETSYIQISCIVDEWVLIWWRMLH